MTLVAGRCGLRSNIQRGQSNYRFMTTVSQLAVRGTVACTDRSERRCDNVLDCAPGDVTVTAVEVALAPDGTDASSRYWNRYVTATRGHRATSAFAHAAEHYEFFNSLRPGSHATAITHVDSDRGRAAAASAQASHIERLATRCKPTPATIAVPIQAWPFQIAKKPQPRASR